MPKTVSIAIVAAGACVALGATSQPSGHSVDWGSIHSFAGNYRSLTVMNGGVREEITGQSKIPFNRSSGLPGSVQYIFTGNSLASARS